MACVQTIEAIVQHGVSKKSLLDVNLSMPLLDDKQHAIITFQQHYFCRHGLRQTYGLLNMF
jgi:ACT domain-containing protein